jgi:hypothetical protein
MDDLQAEEEARGALLRLLHVQGVACSDNDLRVKMVITRTGHPLYVVIALNGTEEPLFALARKAAGRRETSVGAHGVFLLRPSDLGKLLSRIVS